MNIVSVSKQFPTEEACIAHLEKVRWSQGASCPYCHSTNSTSMPKELRHHCNNCNTTFSVTVGTIFHHTHLPLQKWFLAVSLILNAKKGVSSRQLARDLDVNKNTAWRIAMQIRLAMAQSTQRDLLTGLVEMDETYIGGKPRKGDGQPHRKGRGTSKIPVVGMAERGGRVKAEVVKDRKLTGKRLLHLVRWNIDISNSRLITDEYKGYNGASKFLPHDTINHTICYALGDIHTNSIESFWALLKRGIVGQFHKVSIHYLQKYVDEFSYRWNNRKNAGVFDLTIARGMGVA